MDRDLLTVQGLALDAYGTLVEPVSGAWFQWVRRHGDPNRLRTGRRRILTEPLDLSPESLVAIFGLDPEAALVALQLLEEEVSGVRCFADTAPFLNEMRSRGLKWVVVSNLGRSWGAPVRRLLGAWIEDFVFSFETGLLKPDPKIFHLACRRLDLDPARVLMVGDSYRSDVEGARRAGLQALHLRRSSAGKPSAGSTALPSLEQLRIFLKDVDLAHGRRRRQDDGLSRR